MQGQHGFAIGEGALEKGRLGSRLHPNVLAGKGQNQGRIGETCVGGRKWGERVRCFPGQGQGAGQVGRPVGGEGGFPRPAPEKPARQPMPEFGVPGHLAELAHGPVKHVSSP